MKTYKITSHCPGFPSKGTRIEKENISKNDAIYEFEQEHERQCYTSQSGISKIEIIDDDTREFHTLDSSGETNRVYKIEEE